MRPCVNGLNCGGSAAAFKDVPSRPMCDTSCSLQKAHRSVRGTQVGHTWTPQRYKENTHIYVGRKDANGEVSHRKSKDEANFPFFLFFAAIRARCKRVKPAPEPPEPAPGPRRPSGVSVCSVLTISPDVEAGGEGKRTRFAPSDTITTAVGGVSQRHLIRK